MKIYYIYHIPDFVWKYHPYKGRIGKIGCTINPNKRIRNQGYTKYEILEEHTDIYIASEREQELQKEYDYPIDLVPYWMSLKQLEISRAPKLGGKVGGKRTKELGIGIHGLTDEQKTANGKKGNASRKTKGHPPATPIRVFKDNKFIKEYISISECGRDMNLYPGNIHKVLTGKYKQHKGYMFKYNN